jgi:uncharacterized MAPEG superfamily protein
MPVELQLLVWSTALAFVLVLISVLGATGERGLPELAANREGFGECKGWAGRAARAHLNLLENLILFTILVLVAQATGRFNATTALGAQIFFWARVAHAAIYLAGIPWLRTLAWLASIVGLAMIFLQLV